MIQTESVTAEFVPPYDAFETNPFGQGNRANRTGPNKCLEFTPTVMTTVGLKASDIPRPYSDHLGRCTSLALAPPVSTIVLRFLSVALGFSKDRSYSSGKHLAPLSPWLAKTLSLPPSHNEKSKGSWMLTCRKVRNPALGEFQHVKKGKRGHAACSVAKRSWERRCRRLRASRLR